MPQLETVEEINNTATNLERLSGLFYLIPLVCAVPGCQTGIPLTDKSRVCEIHRNTNLDRHYAEY
jgi:hypothetical protein